MFLSTILLKHPSPINCVLHIKLDTSEVPMQHCTSLNQSMVDYTGHFMAYVILRFVDFSRHTSAKIKKRPTGCGVNFRLYQYMPNFLINYESVSARPRFRLNPQPDPSTLYSYNPNVGIFCHKIKLSDSCR